ncbi:MAG: hypothetical protein ABEH90_06270 [Halolamina sp.]
MADHDEHEHDEHGESDGRVTSPMQAYGMREVGVGIAVLLVGLVVTFGLAFGLVGI